MPDELHVMSLMTLLDAVHTDGIAVCRITGVTPVGTRILLTSVTHCPLQTSSFGASIISKITCKNHAWGSWCSLKSCTGTDLCSQPSQWHLDCSLFCYLGQRWQRGVSDVAGKVHFKKIPTSWRVPVPFIVTLTPDARNKPPKRLLKIWLPSSVAVAWLVISIPWNKIQIALQQLQI